jgi:zinc-ribbon family
MILIWGMRARIKALATGEFFCRACGADRTYVLQQFRRWFTFFFIPLFPVGKPLGEQVQCTTCGTVFPTEVLDMPTSAEFSENLGGATRVAAVSMLAAGDSNSPAARRVAIEAARKAGTASYDETWLANDLDALDPSQLRGFLEPLAKGLDPHGKETFVEQIARVGLVDGPLTPPEMQVLESLSAALGLSAAHLRGIIVTTSSPDEYRHN